MKTCVTIQKAKAKDKQMAHYKQIITMCPAPCTIGHLQLIGPPHLAKGCALWSF